MNDQRERPMENDGATARPVGEEPAATPIGEQRPRIDEIAPASEPPASPARPRPASGPVRPAAARRSSSGWKWLLTLLVLALLAGGGFYAWQRYGAPYLASLRTPAPVSLPMGPTPEQLAARLSDLDARVARLAELTGRLAAAEQQVSVLADRLTSLEGAKAQAQDVDQLTQRITSLEEAAGTIGDLQRQLRVVASTAEVTRSGFAKTVGAALSVRHLANAVAQGGSFAPELAEVRAMTVEEPSLAEPVAALEPFAADGVPTLARLKAEFPGVATAAMRAEHAAQGDGLVTRLVNGAKSLVTVRLTGEAAARAGGAQAILARAEDALSGNDLASAVDIAERLTGPSADVARNWLAAARARLAVDKAVATLDRLATQRLASSKG